MPTDDEILERVQLRATAIRRRQRLLVAGCATVVMAVLLGGAVVAGSGRDGGDPVDVAADPVDRTDPATTTTTTLPVADEPCVTTDGDLGSGSPDPGGSPTAPTDGSGSETSTSSTSTDSLPARGEQAGAPPTESSIPPDDPSAATLPTVEASTTTCPIQVHVEAAYDPATRAVTLGVTALAVSLYDAHGFVVWDPADPVRVDLGAVARDQGACDAVAAGGGLEAVAVQRGDFGLPHTYPGGGAKEVVVQFWVQRCGGPADQVEVTVTVPL